MPTNPNMVAIQTVTVGSGGASSIEFTSIPQTYTDLVVKYSLRTNATAASNGYYFQYSFNGSTSNFTQINLSGNGSTPSSSSASAFYGITSASDYTASTFGNGELYIPNYTSSNNKSISQDVVSENNATTSYATLYAALWSNSAAITSITLTPAGGSWVQYSTATLYGVTSAQGSATGGFVTSDANYWYHTFTSSGTFTASTTLSCDVLVIGGGGSGGQYWAGGGGGAGGVKNQALTITSGAHTITVGAGAASNATDLARGTNGSNSSIGSLLSVSGGGGGGGYGNKTPLSGGSGGGAGGDDSIGPTTVSGASAVSGEGNSGGSAYTGTSAGNTFPYFANAGGGGGAGGAGGNGAGAGTTTGAQGNGGAGINLSAYATATGTGVSGFYAGGGGGGGWGYTTNGTWNTYTGGTASAGGGAGGIGQNTSGTAGTTNTGGGGGGAGGRTGAGQNKSGGAGGSGIVIVRYAK